MLRELSIENFALIERLRLETKGGLTVLTGETGAGKSIIVEALSALLGVHTTAEAIRSRAERARVEGVFDLSDQPEIQGILQEAGLADDEDLLILARQIATDRSHYYVNGHAATRTLVRKLGEHLVDLHGQHQHQTLLHKQSHLEFLDTFGSEKIAPARAAYRQAWEEFQRLQEELTRLREAERDRAQRMDLLNFQVQEIADANLSPQTDEALPAEHRRLAHAERLQQAAAEVLAALESDLGEGQGAAEATAAATEALRAVAKFDDLLLPLIEELQSAEIILREVARSLHGYVDGLEFDPRHLAQVEARLQLLDRLQRKYGESVEAILAYHEQAVRELVELEQLDLRLQEIEGELEQACTVAGKAAERLSAARRQQAKALEKAMIAAISKLGMEQGQFAVAIERQPDPSGLIGEHGARYAATVRGLDQVHFLLSANVGEPLRPLSQVASGGELSRLMLAFTSVCAQATAVPTLIFDEIDVGIGGVTAHAVAEKLAQVAQEAQVLCVTHLPQIASRADQHICVSKTTEGQRTVITAWPLAEEERVPELARMFGADTDHEQALRHAEEMLAEAREERKPLRKAGRTI